MGKLKEIQVSFKQINAVWMRNESITFLSASVPSSTEQYLKIVFYHQENTPLPC
jgi:hypothetical protein